MVKPAVGPAAELLNCRARTTLAMKYLPSLIGRHNSRHDTTENAFCGCRIEDKRGVTRTEVPRSCGGIQTTPGYVNSAMTLI